MGDSAGELMRAVFGLVAVGSFIGVAYFSIRQILIVAAMVDAINAHREPSAQIAHVGWGPFRIWRVLREYRRMYPDGELLRQKRVEELRGSVCAVGWLVGLLGWVMAR